jgi:hypothetical protein
MCSSGGIRRGVGRAVGHQGLELRDLRRQARVERVQRQRPSVGALNEDFPELAEPYNNLAVLYAAQGDLDKARASKRRRRAAK